MKFDQVEAIRAAESALLAASDVQDRIRGALLGAALGDALGAPFEADAVVDVAALALHRHGTRVLAHTADTVMTLVLARHALATLAGGADLLEDQLVRDLAWAWRREPWRRYGAECEHVFHSVLAGVPWSEAAGAVGAGTDGNAGAVRVAPLALLGRPLPTVVECARRSAALTHRHPVAQAGAALQAAAVALAATTDARTPLDPDRFLRGIDACHGLPVFGSRLTRVRYLLHDERPARVARSLGTGTTALEAVPAAILAFLRSPDDPEQVLELAVRLGGDTDSIAGMAGALAGARCGASRLPPDALARLEVGDDIVSLADALTDQVVPPVSVSAA